MYTYVTGNWQLPLPLGNSRPTFRSPLANCKAAVRAQLKRALFRSSLFLRPLVLSLRPDETSNKQYDDGTKLQNLQTSDFTPKPPIQGSGPYSDKAEPVSMLVDHPVVQQRPVWRLLGISAPGSLVEPEASDWSELWLWLWLIFSRLDWIRFKLWRLWTTLNSGCISVVGFASEFILNWTKWHASTPRLSLRHLEMREPEVQACNANVKLIQHTTPFLLVWMWVILRFTSVKLKNRTEPELWTIKWQWKWKCPIYTKHSKHLLWTNGVVVNKIWFSSQQWAAMTYS